MEGIVDYLRYTFDLTFVNALTVDKATSTNDHYEYR